MCLDQQENWWKVQSAIDQYVGWLNPRMLCGISPDILSQIKGKEYVLEGSLVMSDDTLMRLPAGARLPVFELNSNEISINGKIWRKGANLVSIKEQDASKRATLIRHFLNTPYLWGGRSSFGIDCSGLTQQVFAMCGISIARDSSQQAKAGRAVAYGQQQTGDLAFFSKPNQNRITHVGMLISKNQIIHAAGRVRCDTFNENGIWNQEIESLTHQLVSIRRW